MAFITNKQNLGNSEARILVAQDLQSPISNTAEATQATETLSSPVFLKDEDAFTIIVNFRAVLSGTTSENLSIIVKNESDTTLFSYIVETSTFGINDRVSGQVIFTCKDGEVMASGQHLFYDASGPTTTESVDYATTSYTFTPAASDAGIYVQLDNIQLDETDSKLMVTVI